MQGNVAFIFKRRDLQCWSFRCSFLKLLRQAGRVVICDLFGKREITTRDISRNWHLAGNQKRPLSIRSSFANRTLPWISLKYYPPFGGWRGFRGSDLLHIDDTESHTSFSWSLQQHLNVSGNYFFHIAQLEWRRLTVRSPTSVALPGWVSTIQVKVLEPSDKA